MHLRSRALAVAQLAFTVQEPGGRTDRYGGSQTYFKVVSAQPTPTPPCQFAPVTRPSADQTRQNPVEPRRAEPRLYHLMWVLPERDTHIKRWRRGADRAPGYGVQCRQVR